MHSRNACGEGVGGQRTFCCPSTTSPHSEAPAASEPSQAQQRSRVSPHCSAACPTREYRGGVYPTHSSAVVRASICTFSNSCGETLSFHPPFTSTATSRDGCSDAAFESPGSPGGDGAGAAAKWRRMRVSPAICATVSTVTPSWGHRHRAMRGSSSSRHENMRQRTRFFRVRSAPESISLIASPTFRHCTANINAVLPSCNATTRGYSTTLHVRRTCRARNTPAAGH